LRKALADFLVQAATEDERVIFLTGDLGFQVFDEFKSSFPKRYYNVGIAEAAMVGIAAGLSYSGFKPIIYSIASFLDSRAFEQLRFFCGYNNMKIISIGAGGGLTYSMSGPTHHALDDIGLALLIPNLLVFSPAGPLELTQTLYKSIKEPESSYIQIGKFGEKDIPFSYNSEKNDKVVGIISTGIVSSYIFENLQKYEYTSKVSHLHVNQIYPLNEEVLVNFLNSHVKIILVEEQIPSSGIYNPILRLINEKKLGREIERLGPKLEFIHINRSLSANREFYNYNWSEIQLRITNYLKQNTEI
jgi:transketolase